MFIIKSEQFFKKKLDYGKVPSILMKTKKLVRAPFTY